MPGLPPGLIVFERGWLSANNILFTGRETTALVDSGYCTHDRQTISLIEQSLEQRPLDLLLNTHLHSDHCGGNAALQNRYPGLQTRIPPGQARHVRHWNPEALSYTPTGQQCPPFGFQALLEPGTEIMLADRPWQIHSAPGHDPHSVILFEPQSRTLISADALWENGFGVIFPELEGESAFAEVEATLNLIESLAPQTVIPGHGQVFSGVDQSLALARSRLAGFLRDPRRHTNHAAKVLLKFKLLELQQIERASFITWAVQTPYFGVMQQRHFPEMSMPAWLEQLMADLVRAGAAAVEGEMILNA
ncbi:MBL fold metallo-hydrolase [Variovorax sp. CYS-02]|uniref:MBL fold metallo-hydrolase n=2 Tax=Variovorax terrae TaxID=2923278 RepID=A0A9X1VQY4_9BURK|nr:MBL fold metallo-hydrolase [Variovorax terrae]MCJ0761697.1 MBL fold metallo-hydrolase [Variovorax terrae]